MSEAEGGREREREVGGGKKREWGDHVPSVHVHSNTVWSILEVMVLWQ